MVVVVAAFAALWWSGQLKRLSDYISETYVELQKCSWPTWAELKGSTLVVFISIGILGAFTVAVDWVFSHLILWIH